MKLEGTVALVTGAARRLGRLVAMRLAERGCDVVVHYGRSRSQAEETVKAIQALGRSARPIPADLRRPEAIDRLFGEIEREVGRLDILVNSAASFDRKPLEEVTVDEWDEAIALNTRAPFLCMQRGVRLMHASERRSTSGELGAPGFVLNMGDHAGVTTWRGFSAHGVSKAGLLHLTRIAARELAPAIRVAAIVPGPILPPPGESDRDESWAKKGARVPLGVPGSPDQIASTAIFLAENDYVTGDTIFVDGGEHLLPGGHDR
ncbi:MAG: SDR family oxidoreductase [Gemmatimonadetes bacterium]|nr:SDR family oxidoreductase [Gemmatimonadota bacterium]